MKQTPAIILRALVLTAMALGLTHCGCATKPCKNCQSPPEPGRFAAGEFIGVGPSGTYPTYVTHSPGNPMLLLHELPGLTPGALDFALTLEKKGRRVYAPLLFGGYGQQKGLGALPQIWATGRWNTLSGDSPGPILDDTWAMLNQIAKEQPGKSIMVAGNCLTGNLPLDLIAHPQVSTALICQPALPFTLPGIKWQNEAWPITRERLDRSITAMRDHPKKQLVFVQYVDDRIAPLARTLRILGYLEGAQLLPQVHLVIGATSEQEALSPFTPAQRKRVQWVQVTDQAGHSTVTGAGEPDRRGFRTKVLDILRSGR